MADLPLVVVQNYETGKRVRVTWQECDPIIELNKRLQSEPQRRGETFRLVGTIPEVILLKWLNEEWERGNTTLKWIGEEFNQLVWRKLQDPDWKYLRTTWGSL